MPAQNLVVTDQVDLLPPAADHFVTLSATEYLDSASAQTHATARVFNLCPSYAYQTKGYYVSLLAEARGHRAIPSVTTLRDFDSPLVVRSLGEEINEVIQQSLRKASGDHLSLEIYFGQATSPGLQRLAAAVYRMFPSPILEVELIRKDVWILSQVRATPLGELSEASREAFQTALERFFQKRMSLPKATRQRYLFDLAILFNPDEAHPPSNPRAIEKFTDAARDVGFYTELIKTDEADRICEFDALFIRETTSVNHPTYHLSRLAHAEGLVVIDDETGPSSSK